MTARYRILLADPLLGMGLQFPPGVSLAGQMEAGPAGTHWHLLDDPGAPADLEGREVAIAMARDDDGLPVITSRRLIVTHLAGDDGLACCGTAPWEIPPGDRVTGDPQSATCRAAVPAGMAPA